MNISYDVKVDALYIKFIPGRHQVQTRNIDSDIALDFDEADRLIGIEVLDASKRLEPGYLLPVGVSWHSNEPNTPTARETKLRNGLLWDNLRPELLRLKKAHQPVRTKDFQWKNWIEEVGDDYVDLRSDRGKGRTIRITRRQLEGNAERPYIIRALRELADKG